MLLTVYTGRRLYKDMLISGLSVLTDRYTDNALLVKVQCREILTAKIKTVTVNLNPKTQIFPQQTQGSGARDANAAGGVKHGEAEPDAVKELVKLVFPWRTSRGVGFLRSQGGTP